MEYVSAYILLNENRMDVNKSTISRLLSSIQASYTEESLDLFLEKIQGKSYEEIISAGSELMKSKFVGSAQATPTSTTTAAAPKAQVQEEEEESSDADMNFF